MKNINDKPRCVKSKMKGYYAGVALIALMCASSISQAMDKDEYRYSCRRHKPKQCDQGKNAKVERHINMENERLEAKRIANVQREQEEQYERYVNEWLKNMEAERLEVEQIKNAQLAIEQRIQDEWLKNMEAERLEVERIKNAQLAIEQRIQDEWLKNRSTTKADNFLQPHTIKSDDKEAINSYQKKKDDYDQERIDHHLAAHQDEETPKNVAALFHAPAVVNILDEQEARHLAVSLTKVDSYKLPDYSVDGNKSEEDSRINLNMEAERLEVERIEIAQLAKKQRNTGDLYHNGEGVKQDYAEAMRWYLEAAEKNDAKAQIKIGNLYSNGLGVEKNYIEAARWLHKAAEQGHVFAQFKLGLAYENGRGISQDYVEAMRWYQKAADQGHIVAQFKLGLAHEKAWGYRNENFLEAKQCYQKAADQGHTEAQIKLSIIRTFKK